MKNLRSRLFILLVLPLTTAMAHTGATINMGYFKQAFTASVNAYPNPFSNAITIFYTAVSTGNAAVYLYSKQGQLIGEIYNDKVISGKLYQFELDGQHLSPGIYYYTIECQGSVTHHRIELVR